MRSYRHRPEHRVLMEVKLGRTLRKNEVVHHINGNGRDNRLENLTVMTVKAHARLHGKQRRGIPRESVDVIKGERMMIRFPKAVAIAVRDSAKSESRSYQDQILYLVKLGLRERQEKRA